MSTARFYRRERNDGIYQFSKSYMNVGDIKDYALNADLKAEVFDEENEKLRVFTPQRA